MSTCSGSHTTPRDWLRYSATAFRSGIQPATSPSTRCASVARRTQRPVTCAQRVVGNSDRAGWFARKALSPGRRPLAGRSTRDPACDNRLTGGRLLLPARSGSSPRAASTRSSWSGSTSVTYVPEPVRARTYPSTRSCSNAACTVPRATPCSRARVRLAGSRVPARSRPESISCLRASTSQSVVETRADRSARARTEAGDVRDMCRSGGGTCARRALAAGPLSGPTKIAKMDLLANPIARYH